MRPTKFLLKQLILAEQFFSGKTRFLHWKSYAKFNLNQQSNFFLTNRDISRIRIS